MRRTSTTLLFLAILPPLAVAILIAYFGVNSPHWDEWNCEGSVSRAYLESRPLAPELVKFCNESRPVFPKILWLGVAILTQNSRVAEMFVGWIFVCLTAWNLYQLSGRNPAMTLLMNCVLFHPIQHENWLWGSQNMLFVPALCLTVMLRVLLSPRLSGAAQIGWSGVMPLVATYSFANGILLWPALFVSLPLATRFQDVRWRRQALLTWIGVALTSVPPYFIGFERAPGSPGFLANILGLPIRTAHYILTFLGQPFAAGGSLLFAAGIAIVMLACIAYCVWRARVDRTTGPWLILGGYAVVSAVIAGAGRVHFGVIQATENRYTAFSCWLAVCLIGTAFIAWPRLGRGARAAVVAVGIMLGLLYGVSYHQSIRQQNNRSLAGRHQRACLHFFQVLPGGSCAGNYPVWSLEFLREAAPPLNRGGWIHPPLAETAVVPVTPVASEGQAAELAKAGDVWNLKGLVSRGDPDAVVVAIRSSPSAPWEAKTVVGVGRSWAWNSDGHWSAKLTATDLPAEDSAGRVIGIFAYRANEPRWRFLQQLTPPR